MANIFKMLNPFSGASGPELVGIDVGDVSLKLAHVKGSHHKPEVVNLLNRDISGLSKEEIPKIIRTYLNDLKIKNLRILNIVPTHLIITKNIEIPSVKPQEINEIIDLQAGRHTPYSREEIIIDHINIGTHKQNYTKILLVIAARSIIKRQFEILGGARMRLEKVALAPESLARCLPKILRLETKDAPISLIHIDERFSDFVVVFRDNPIFVRSIPIGALHFTEDRERNKSKFIEEILHSLEAYQSEDIEKNPNRVVLTGAIEGIKDLEPALSESLHLPINMVTYLQNLVVSEQAKRAVSEAKYSSFLNVIAPLVACSDLKVNLIPEEVKQRKALEEKGRELIKSGVYILTIFVLVFSLLVSKIHFRSLYLDRLNVEYEKLDKDAGELEYTFSRISVIKKYLASRGYSLGVLTELYKVMPVDMKLSEIKFDSGSKLSVKGTGMSMSTVFSFVDKMEKSEYFKEVKTRYTTKRKDGLMDVADFEIIALFER